MSGRKSPRAFARPSTHKNVVLLDSPVPVMFATLSTQPADPLLALIGAFNADERPDKIDLGVGVYRDEAGRTPIFRAVKAAEHRLWQTQESKAYIGPECDRLFLERLWRLVGGQAVAANRVAGVQTPGGSGALRLAAELLKRAGSGRIWLGLPSWPNHAGIFAAAGLAIETYPFFDVAAQSLTFEAMLDALGRAQAGDGVLLHASCHNPTGAVLGAGHWRALGDVILSRGLVPLIDNAYQGFGQGLEADAAGLRGLIARVPEALVAVSASKSFGLYRERTGAIYALGTTPAAAEAAGSHLVALARTGYSMPPDHGAAIVRDILGDEALRQDWQDELEAMRRRIAALRMNLAKALACTRPVIAAVAAQEGMFSLLPITAGHVLDLRQGQGIYLPSSGRINIAGLPAQHLARVAASLVEA